MPATITATIGTGGTYSTPTLWEAARPADLRAGTGTDEQWVGLCKNQTFGPVTIAGCIGDATHRTTLSTDVGASYIDQATQPPLRVDTTKGATLRTTSSYQVVVSIGEDFVTLSKLQIEINGAIGGSTGAVVATLTTGALLVDSCIIESSRPLALTMLGAVNIIKNSVICCRVSGASLIANIKGGCAVYNTIFAVPSGFTAATAAVGGAYSASSFTNCAFFGVSALSSGTAPTYTTCATSTTGTTGVTGSVAFSTATFNGVTDAARDWRLPLGSALIDTGTTDAANVPTDAFGRARPQGASTDIGPFEYLAAAGFIPRAVILRQAVKRASFY